MRIVTAFPREVLDIENLFIPLSDGTRLAARLWRPVDAERDPVPAILEYIPYRKGDRMRERDEPMHRYFAGHGYAAVRVDLRGTGDSEGLLLDEYHPQEIDDALEVLAWLARQSWCTGAVGMMGKSWGGFNALQVAAKRPKQLRAILTVCASDDRYTDDAHYMGGCLLNENLVWGAALFTLSALPPDPQVWERRWREMWISRMNGTVFFPERWLRHPLRDDYWKHGSISEDYGAITCPVYAVGGWMDAYTNAIPRLLASLDVPRKGLVGPWAHVYPHNGVPGPAIGFLQEARRWWDQWLKGADSGILDEPMFRVYLPEPVASSERSLRMPGRWVAEDSWPSPRIETRRFALSPGRLESGEPTETASLALRSPLTTGLRSGSWCSFGSPEESPLDQNDDDAKSILFDSGTLDERLEILGAPEIRLRIASDCAVGMLATRLEDVFPDGTSVRVTYGLLDLTHRAGHETSVPLVPGETCDVSFFLNDTAYAFVPGHRLRLALATSYWPLVWPLPVPFELTLRTESSFLILPVRPPRPEDAELRPFAPPESAPNARVTEIVRGSTSRTIEWDPSTGIAVYRVSSDSDEDGEPALTRVEATGIEHGHASEEVFSIEEGDPLSARTEIRHDARFQRDGWKVRVTSLTRLKATDEGLVLEGELEGFEDSSSVFHRTWRSVIPRS